MCSLAREGTHRHPRGSSDASEAARGEEVLECPQGGGVCEAPPQGVLEREQGDPGVALSGVEAEGSEAHSRTTPIGERERRRSLLYRQSCTTLVAAKERPGRGQGGDNTPSWPTWAPTWNFIYLLEQFSLQSVSIGRQISTS